MGFRQWCDAKAVMCIVVKLHGSDGGDASDIVQVDFSSLRLVGMANAQASFCSHIAREFGMELQASDMAHLTQEEVTNLPVWQLSQQLHVYASPERKVAKDFAKALVSRARHGIHAE